jgi:hypothetical protein
MTAENDDLYLDLSYMDENADSTAQNGNDNSYNGQGDIPDLYAEETYADITPTDQVAQQDLSHPAAEASDTNGDQNTKTEYSQDANVEDAVNENKSHTEDASNKTENGSRKRKERDDDDEYSQTMSQGQGQTPRPTSTTPMPHGSFGQPTHALNVQQLTHNTSEEEIRELANAVGREADLEELKFDEYKPNGKSKGYVHSI